MPTIGDLLALFERKGCRVVCAGGLDRNVSVPRMTHVEDARPGTVAWYRGGGLPKSFNGDALVAHPDTPIDGAAKLVAYHADPRDIMRRLIDERGYGSPGRLVPVKFGLEVFQHKDSVIGAAGQGYDWAGNHYDPFPHAGGVRIGSHVDIGPMATIMRGSVGDTVIGSGSKIGNGVNVGHDTRIGRDCLLAAHACLAGWVRVGDGVRIWMGALVKNGVSIGEGAQIGMGAVVLEDVPAGEVWAGNPARRIR